MSIRSLEKFDLGDSFYNFRDKLWLHIAERSEECFERAEKTRASINTTAELSQYAQKHRREFIEALGMLPYDNTLPLNAKTVGVIREDSLTIEKIIFDGRGPSCS